jgi:archaellum component FlaG (FlaF/FlaG flagellin family)
MIAFIALLAVISLLIATISQKALTDSCMDFVSALEDVKVHLAEENWVEAINSMREFERGWDRYKWRLTIIIDHSLADSISNNIYQLAQSVENRDFNSSMSILYMVVNQIKNTPANSELRLENIF